MRFHMLNVIAKIMVTVAWEFNLLGIILSTLFQPVSSMLDHIITGVLKTTSS